MQETMHSMTVMTVGTQAIAILLTQARLPLRKYPRLRCGMMFRVA